LAAAPAVSHGLAATYFDNADFTGAAVTRIDPFIDFDFGIASPAPSISADSFSARWTGQVEAPYTESFTFYTRSDNGVRLWVNNVLVINNWTSHQEAENASPPQALVAGQSYDIKLEYYDDTGRATVKLLWASPSTPKVVVPSEALQPLSAAAPDGRLLLETFNNISGDTVAELTAHNAFPSSPSQSQYVSSFEVPSNRSDQFGSRVRGYIVAPETGAYTFWISGDNEAQLFVSSDESTANKRLIATTPTSGNQTPRDWDQFGSQRSQPVRLIAGQRYYIEALHKEGTGNDHLAVGWELPSGLWERPIPPARLLPLLPGVRVYTLSPSTHESSTSPATFTVVRDDDFARELTVRYYLGGMATNGIDYVHDTGAIVIPAGASSAQVTVAPLTDSLVENKETVVLMLAPSDDYVLGPPSTMTATASITDGLPAIGGTSLLPTNPLTTVGFSGGQFATRQVVNVTGMPFSQALQVRTNTKPANVWDIQLRWNNAAAIQQSNTLFATFWLRNADPTKPEAHVDIVFEMNGAPWTKSAAHVSSVGSEWTRIDIPFRAAASYSVGGAAFALRFGYLPQTVQIGGISLTNYGNSVSVSSLPQTQLSYPGNEGTADWRAQAESRIEQIRKAPLTITVKDAAGTPIEGAKVEVVLRKHEFGFGSAIAANPVLNNTTVDGSRYRAIVKSLYSKVVTENALKWPNWQSSRQTGINLVNWLTDNGLAVRGHTLVWPSWQYLPSSLKSTFDSRVASEGQTAAADWLRQAVISHIADEASTLAGKLVAWDVINEPYANHDLMDILGNAAMIDWFRQAKQSDPHARLYLNDYSILEARGTDYSHQDHFFNTIQYLRSNGAPLEGIGIQGHFGSGLTGAVRMLEILDRFATFGVPIEATEFDVNVADEQIQADYMRDFMTTLFSHPAVNSILMWGFWQNAHWLPQAALYRSDWTIKPNGQAWIDLVHNLWTTEIAGTTLADGRYGTRAFRGTYDITVSFGGQSKMAAATLVAGGTAIDVILDGTLVWAPRNLTATAASSDAINVGWNASPVAVDGYKIERQRPGLLWAEIAEVPSNVLSFADRNVEPDALYNYRVRAYRVGAPSSEYSNVASARTLSGSFAGTDGDDRLILRASTDGATLEIYNNDPLPGVPPVFTWPMNATTPLGIDTLAGNDVITIDLPAGANGPLGGLRLVNGSGNNELHVRSGRVALTPDSPRTNVLSALVIGVGASLDLSNNDLIVNTTAANKAAVLNTLYGALSSGFAGGAWNGPGLVSSAARTNAETTLSLVDNALLGYTQFSGAAVDNNSILLKHTYFGDIDQNGAVDADDLTVFANNFGRTSGATQVDGDIDFNGTVDADDLTVFANNFGKGIGMPLVGSNSEIVTTISAPCLVKRCSG
jgi:GH35 family endo-1,4-beta-xylanase